MKKFYVTKKRVSDFISSMKDKYKSIELFKADVEGYIEELKDYQEFSINQRRFYSAVLKELNEYLDFEIQILK